MMATAAVFIIFIVAPPDPSCWARSFGAGKRRPSYKLTVMFLVARQKLQLNNDREEMNAEVFPAGNFWSRKPNLKEWSSIHLRTHGHTSNDRRWSYPALASLLETC
jgi:hypothetical protein